MHADVTLSMTLTHATQSGKLISPDFAYVIKIKFLIYLNSRCRVLSNVIPYTLQRVCFFQKSDKVFLKIHKCNFHIINLFQLIPWIIRFILRPGIKKNGYVQTRSIRRQGDFIILFTSVSCTLFGFASGCIVVLQCVTISIFTDMNVDN